ncbi:hypothetical protein TH63_18565 [Rufibacter radiotolerans]|uniref:DUF3899 domain-containing protein n=1 Tax=Rufibacter radiotolerans TaxID=1379910 RepID=A0A0H4VPG6_9BACT|nr:hypothetical protein [Rufibacter radiotolerans]AKQ47188.1 hypothetical protein TH63_18565 [Rufibacter radiotolerans]
MNQTLNGKKHLALFYLGFIVFLIGYSSVFFGLGILEFLQIIGTAISILAIKRWLRAPEFKAKFRKENNEDGLTYFWNKIVMRLWSAMFFSFMLFSTLSYFLRFILS